MPDYSIGEVDSLVLKACRGAGYSWGLAQEAGNAAAWMAMQGMPSLDEFALLVQKIDKMTVNELTPVNIGLSAGDTNIQHWSAPARGVCPVLAGLAFAESDLSQVDWVAGVVMENILQPLVLTHFVARAADQLTLNLVVTIGATEIVCGEQQARFVADRVDQPGFAGPEQSDVIIRRSARGQQAGTIYQRASGLESGMEVLQHYAHRTYVPASEDSRNSGAGAGILDND